MLSGIFLNIGPILGSVWAADVDPPMASSAGGLSVATTESTLMNNFGHAPTLLKVHGKVAGRMILPS